MPPVMSFPFRWSRRPPSIAKPSIAKPTAMILVDLENVGTRALQNSIDVLHSLCTRASVKLRTYTAKRNNLASLATDTVASTAKNAVDVRIAFDIGRTSLKAGPGSRFLVVTKDHFGKALAEVPSASTDHVTIGFKAAAALAEPTGRAVSRRGRQRGDAHEGRQTARASDHQPQHWRCDQKPAGAAAVVDARAGRLALRQTVPRLRRLRARRPGAPRPPAGQEAPT